jgi:hypothetical protein
VEETYAAEVPAEELAALPTCQVLAPGVPAVPRGVLFMTDQPLASKVGPFSKPPSPDGLIKTVCATAEFSSKPTTQIVLNTAERKNFLRVVVVELFMLLFLVCKNVELIITFTIYYINEINVIFLLIIDYCSKFINYFKRNKKKMV